MRWWCRFSARRTDKGKFFLTMRQLITTAQFLARVAWHLLFVARTLIHSVCKCWLAHDNIDDGTQISIHSSQIQKAKAIVLSDSSFGAALVDILLGAKP